MMSRHPKTSGEDFEGLRQLLALKRHEQPPPGFFHNFSDQVINRIDRLEMESAERSPLLAWWERLYAWLLAQPSLAGASALAAIALLATGITLAPTSQPTDPLTSTAAPGVVQAAMLDWTKAAPRPARSFVPAFGTSSTAPVLAESLNPPVQPVAWRVP